MEQDQKHDHKSNGTNSNGTIISIMCGGSGTRLFPFSTKDKPKQFLRLENEHSLLQNTIMRLANFKHVVLISSKDHAGLLQEQLKEVNVLLKDKLKFTIILEPFMRNTCPAITVLSQMYPTNDIIVMPADHIFEDAKIAETLLLAEKGLKGDARRKVTVFGIRATHPETGFGYLHSEDRLSVSRFVEKPNLETATEYIKSGEYFWNSGIFGFNSVYMAELLSKHQPEIFSKCAKLALARVASDDPNITMVSLPDEYRSVTNISIDYAIMEKLKRDEMAFICYSGMWNDIGSWSSVHQVKEKDCNDINKDAKVKSVDSKDCLVMAQKPVFLNGVEDLVIVETNGCIMVSRKSKSQNVKKLVEL